MLATVGFTSLGVWQLARAESKQRLLDAWSAAQNEPPRAYSDLVGSRRSLPRRDQASSAADTWAMLPARARIQGRWDPRMTVLLDNQRRGAQVGFLVFTRFVPVGSGTPVLVSRGWLPLPGDRRVPPIDPPADGEVSITGLLVPPPSTGLRLGDADWSPDAPSRLLPRLDIGALSAARGPLFDGVLQLDADAADGFEREWAALPNTLPPEKHRGYALQWFALAAACVVMFVVLMLKRR